MKRAGRPSKVPPVMQAKVAAWCEAQARSHALQRRQARAHDVTGRIRSLKKLRALQDEARAFRVGDRFVISGAPAGDRWRGKILTAKKIADGKVLFDGSPRRSRRPDGLFAI